MYDMLLESTYSDLIVPIIIVLLLVGAGFGILKIVRKRMMLDEFDKGPTGWTLGDLRQMVKDGKMTQEEFDKAKIQIIAATQRDTAQKTKPAPQPPLEHKTRPDDPH